jgi:hypothetical protein
MAINRIRLLHSLSIVILCTAILSILLIEIILNLTPPIDRDALIHHLAIPKLWLKNGGFYEMKWAVFSYYPMNVDLLYLIPVYFNKDFIAKFIHMGFGIGTALLIYHYLSRKINYIAGLLGILVFLSTPMIVRLSMEAYVDLGLIFFTTASMIAFIHYRDGEYKDFKWLFLSSVAMGIALGTKYNALIAWFFLSTAIVFVYSRNTGEQWKAIKCGSIFFLISLAVFSPWLIKNYILTGNPLYPLLQGIFSITDTSVQEGTRSISGGTYSGIFQTREVMYGENFWETLFIPIRYFFQGQDDNFRYFDGVLNPILIIFSPFAFMNKSFYRDKLFFTGFTIFFVLTATFLDQTRIRYILPVVPILSILSVMGVINILNWIMNLSVYFKNIITAVVLLIFVIFISNNFFYIKKYYQNISPMNYISGKESRDAFISRHVGSYPAMNFINQFTPENAKIRLILLAGRGYYLDRIYEADSSMGMAFISSLVRASSDDITFQKHIDSLDYTHLLLRIDLFYKFLQDNYSTETTKQFLQQLKRSTEIIYNANGYAVVRLIPERKPLPQNQ